MITDKLLTIKEITTQVALDAFQGHGVRDRVNYYEGRNTQWFLFGDDGEPPFGHASMAKIGSGQEEKDSSHYRFGKWYIDPQHRGTSLGAIYAGCLIYHFLKHVMTASSYKTITLRAWNELVPKYSSNEWINTQKVFKGPFTEMRKVFYFSWGGDLIEQQGSSGKICEGIIYKNDWKTPCVVIPLE